MWTKLRNDMSFRYQTCYVSIEFITETNEHGMENRFAPNRVNFLRSIHIYIFLATFNF